MQEAAAREFRPSAFHLDGSMQTVSLVLCNDKPQTFGAPDVLRLSLDQLAVKYMMDLRFHDRPARPGLTPRQLELFPSTEPAQPLVLQSAHT